MITVSSYGICIYYTIQQNTLLTTRTDKRGIDISFNLNQNVGYMLKVIWHEAESLSPVYATPRFYLPGGKSNLQLHILSEGSISPNVSFSFGSGTPCHFNFGTANVPAKFYLNPSNSLSRIHEMRHINRQTTDRETALRRNA